MSLFRSLRIRNFTLLWIGQSLSRVGDHLYQIALAWWVLEKTGSALAMGTVLVLSVVPMLLFLLVGGAAVDRFRRTRLMFLSDLGRGALMAVVAVLAFAGQLEVWQIYLATFAFSAIDAVFGPAYTALVPQLVPEDNLPSANALSSMSATVGRIAGPIIGAALVAAGGTTLVFGVNSLSFFLSAAFLVPLLRIPNVTQPNVSVDSADPASTDSAGTVRPRRWGLLGDVREGVSTIMASPILWVGILVWAIVNMTLLAPFAVAMPFLVKDSLGSGVRTLGALYSVFAAGYLIGGIWLGRKSRLRHRGLLIFGGAIVGGLGLAVLGLPVPLALIFLAALINGAALEASGLTWTTTLQELVPGDKLGRVVSIDMLGSFILLPLGYALIAVATETWGPAAVFVAGGLLTAVVSALPLLNPTIRNLD